MSAVATSVDTHQPGPFPDDAPYTRYCLHPECGKVWPCPDRLASLEPPPPPPRRPMEAAEVAIARKVALWWHVEGVEGLEYFARCGGTVVDYADDRDGRRTFDVLYWHKRKPGIVQLASADVEPAGCHEPDISMLRSHAVELARVVSEGGSDRARLRWLQLAARMMERAAP